MYSHTHPKGKMYLKIIMLLSLLGMLVSAYLAYQHFKPVGGPFCNINSYINCDIVNKSSYSEIFNIPVAILGFAAYAIVFIAAFGLLKEKFPSYFLGLVALFTGASLGFAIYLSSMEAFVLRALCLYCITSQIIILIIFIISLNIWLKHRRWLAHSSSLSS